MTPPTSTVSRTPSASSTRALVGSMSGHTLRLARERLRLSYAELAGRSGVAEETLRLWEHLPRVPEPGFRRLDWAFWTFEREQVLAGSGLPECPVEEAWKAGPRPHGAAMARHREGCALCGERDAFARARLPQRPAAPWWDAPYRAFERWVPWKRAAAVGAVAALACGGVAAWITSILALITPDPGVAAPAALLLGFPVVVALAGAAAGVVWRESRHARGNRRDEVRGGMMAATAGALVLFTLLRLLAGADGLRLEPDAGLLPWLAVGALAAAAGAALGPVIGSARALEAAEVLGRGRPRLRPLHVVVAGSVVALVAALLLLGALQPGIPAYVARVELAGPDPSLAPLLERVHATPGSAAAHHRLGVGLMKVEYWSEATDALERATALDGDLVAAWRDLGRARLKLGEPYAAEDAARRALSLSPGDVEAQEVLAAALYARGHYQQAMHPAWVAATARNTADAWLLAARVSLATGSVERAEDALEAARRIDPGLVVSEGAEVARQLDERRAKD